MTLTRYYIKLGSEVPFGTSEHRITYDPADLSTVRDIWAALPPDLRLALAKTAPRVAGPWEHNVEHDYWGRWTDDKEEDFLAGVERDEGGSFLVNCKGVDVEFPTLASAQSACDAALLAQGYVPSGDTP